LVGWQARDNFRSLAAQRDQPEDSGQRAGHGKIWSEIDTDEDRNLVSPFLDQQKWSRTVYFENGLQRLLQVNSIPTTILFDKQGHIAARMTGFLPDKFVDQLTERIRSALAEAQ